MAMLTLSGDRLKNSGSLCTRWLSADVDLAENEEYDCNLGFFHCLRKRREEKGRGEERRREGQMILGVISRAARGDVNSY